MTANKENTPRRARLTFPATPAAGVIPALAVPIVVPAVAVVAVLALVVCLVLVSGCAGDIGQQPAGAGAVAEQGGWSSGTGDPPLQARVTPPDWRDRTDIGEVAWRFDPADAPDPPEIDASEYFTSAASAAPPTWEEVSALQDEAFALRDKATEAAREYGPDSEEYHEAARAMTEAYERRNALYGTPEERDRETKAGNHFSRCYIGHLAGDDLAAAEADGEQSVQALAGYLWRKYGLDLAADEWSIAHLQPVLYDRATGELFTSTGGSEQADVGYTGYFYAELDRLAEDGRRWFKALTAVYSPASSCDLFSYGGMDTFQYGSAQQALSEDLAQAFPRLDAAAADGTGRNAGDAADEAALGRAADSGALDVAFDAYPALGGAGMVAEYVEDGAPWDAVATPGCQVTVSARYAASADDVRAAGGVGFGWLERRLNGAGAGVAALVSVAYGTRTEAFEGGYSFDSREWRANAAWLDTHEPPAEETPVQPALGDELERPFTVAQAETMTPADVAALEEAGFTHLDKRYPDDFGVPEADKYEYVRGSAGSADGVRDAIAANIDPNGDASGGDEITLLSCEVEEDFGLAWGVRFEYEHRPYTPQTRSYGSPVRYERTGIVFNSAVYDWSGDVMGTRDPAEMKRALDEDLRCNILKTGGFCVVATGIREGAPGTTSGDAAWELPDDAVARTDGTLPAGWTYRAYVLKTVYGDWGMSDEATLVRYSVYIDAATGAMSQPEEAELATASGSWEGV